MRDYSTGRAFRHNDKISSVYIANWQALLNQNRAGIRTVEFTSIYTEGRRTQGSLSTVLTSSASKTTYASQVFLGWGLSGGNYRNDVGFFHFATSPLSAVYGLTNERIFAATLAIWTHGVGFTWGGTNAIPLLACTVTGVDYMTSATLSSGNYAVSDNQASVTLFPPPNNAYSNPYYSHNDNVRMDFVSAPGFCQTLNLTGNTIVAVWCARVGQDVSYTGVSYATCATLSVLYSAA